MCTIRFDRFEAAAYLLTRYGLSLTPGTLVVLRSKGRGPEAEKVGGRLVYAQAELDRFALSSNRR